MRDSLAFRDVERIVVEITGSWGGNMNGRMFEYGPDSKACFIIRCPFSQCYGASTGFRFDGQVRELVGQRLASSTFRVWCGGYGDRGLLCHCDDWVELRVSVTYREGPRSCL